ncbi:MAG TPA: hypothetical protein VNO30_08840 [Kofleriaceae bacterium]|nr:hypothetical protein [Kofleriaceae bacterium]
MMTEDLQREPDGIPHAVIGFTALYCVLLATLLFAILTSASSGLIGAVIFGLLALPVITLSLKRVATRDRDHVHPSR